MKNYKIGYAACVGERDVMSTIDYAVENGFNGAEINMNVPCYFPENYSKSLRQEIKKYKETKNVELTLHAPEDITLLQLQDEIHKAGMNRLKEVIDFGADIGASRMTLHIGTSVCFTMVDKKIYIQDLYYSKYKRILKTSLKELIEYCGDRIKLCIENSGRFPQELVQETLNEMLDKENLFLTWDIGHSYENKYNEVEFFMNHLDKVKICHLHDNNGRSDHQVIGEGNIDFNEVFERLGDKDVVFIVEVRPREKATEAKEELLKILK